MTRSTNFIAAALFSVAFAAVPSVMAQGVKQTVVLSEIDPLTLATGYRSSKVVGSTVYNDNKEEIGKIDDLIITTTKNVPFAVVSVGGFLGMGKHYVVVAASSLEVIGGQLTLHGATKESLKALPDYNYTY